MKTSALLLLAGVLLCFLTIVSVLVNIPIPICALLCIGGTGSVIASMHELCHYN